jgi:hypothetical protein
VTRLSLTPPFLTDEIITSFRDNHDVVEAGVASSLVPFALNGYPIIFFRGGYAVDAGLSNVIAFRPCGGETGTESTSNNNNSKEKGFFRDQTNSRQNSMPTADADANIVENISNLFWDTYHQIAETKENLVNTLKFDNFSNKYLLPSYDIKERFGLVGLGKLASQAVIHDALQEAYQKVSFFYIVIIIIIIIIIIILFTILLLR